MLERLPSTVRHGIRGKVTRTNLAYANEHRDWQVYADLAQVLIRKAHRLYADDRTELEKPTFRTPTGQQPGDISDTHRDISTFRTPTLCYTDISDTHSLHCNTTSTDISDTHGHNIPNTNTNTNTNIPDTHRIMGQKRWKTGEFPA